MRAHPATLVLTRDPGVTSTGAVRSSTTAATSTRRCSSASFRPRTPPRCWRAGVNGAEKELAVLAERFGGHALMISPLGTALARFCDGDLS